MKTILLFSAAALCLSIGLTSHDRLGDLSTFLAITGGGLFVYALVREFRGGGHAS